jgi:hypothetical protein
MTRRRNSRALFALLAVVGIIVGWRFVGSAVSSPRPKPSLPETSTRSESTRVAAFSRREQHRSVAPLDCQSICGTECVRGSCPRVCSSDLECAPTEICGATAAGLWRCLPSNCTTDSDCPDGACLDQPRRDRSIRRCVKNGARPVNSPCRGENSCAAGLYCVEGVCLPKTCAEGCPKGSACINLKTEDSSSRCIPACDKDADCPEGLGCLIAGEGRRQCTKRGEADCLEKGCTDGKICATLKRGPDAIVADCVASCGSSDECSEGSSCALLYSEDARDVRGCMPSCKSDAECGARRCTWKPGLPPDTKVCLP